MWNINWQYWFILDKMVNTENPTVYALVTGEQTNLTHELAKEHDVRREN